MTSTDQTPRLNRAQHGRPAAPVRIVHLGIGNFTRAHQAWYTEHAPDAEQWGIAAFTGRRPDTADALNPQDGLYTLVIGAADGDRYEVISSLSAVHPSTDHAAFLDYLRSPETAIITTTVTEAGYQRADDGHLDVTKDIVKGDIEGLSSGDADYAPKTAPAKVVAGLRARRDAGAGALTILPCDNLPDNGQAFRTVIRDLAQEVDPSLLDWIDQNVAFATSMVDRITPATTDETRAQVAKEQGYTDASPVPTEPFSEWVVAGEFPAGRPAWDEAGAQIVDDVEPFEQRKLWLLNGSHSLMAYAATIVGHTEVREGISDPVVRGWVDEWWDTAAEHLSVPAEDVAAYREALVDRFANPQVHHLLAQIAADGSQKIPVRIFPALLAERAAGRLPDAPVRAIAAWLLHLQGHGAPVTDERGEQFVELAKDKPVGEAAKAVLGVLEPKLAQDDEVIAAIERLAGELLELEGSAGR